MKNLINKTLYAAIAVLNISIANLTVEASRLNGYNMEGRCPTAPVMLAAMKAGGFITSTGWKPVPASFDSKAVEVNAKRKITVDKTSNDGFGKGMSGMDMSISFALEAKAADAKMAITGAKLTHGNIAEGYLTCLYDLKSGDKKVGSIGIQGVTEELAAERNAPFKEWWRTRCTKECTIKKCSNPTYSSTMTTEGITMLMGCKKYCSDNAKVQKDAPACLK